MKKKMYEPVDLPDMTGIDRSCQGSVEIDRLRQVLTGRELTGGPEARGQSSDGPEGCASLRGRCRVER